MARSPNAAADKLINLYPEAIADGGMEAGFFSRCPGLLELADIGPGPIRGEWQLGGYLYVVSGPSLYRVANDWTSTFIGTVTGLNPVSMSDNGTQIFIACNPKGFIYNTSTGVFQQITDADFAGAVVVGYISGYFVFIEPGSQRVWVTALLDGTSVDPLDFASAEGSPDGLVSMIIDHKEIWLLGTESIEVWYVTDAGADFPLAPIQGAFIEQGCAAAFSVAKLDNSIFWLGSDDRGDGIVWRANGYTPTRVSTHAVEYAIAQYGDISDAVAYSYQQDGHLFYVLTFPSANATWCYDAATKMWHQRAYMVTNTGELIRHRSNCQAFFADMTVVGDFETGKIYQMSLDVYDDMGDAQKWLRAWRALPTGQNNLNRTFQHSLQIEGQMGVGLSGSTDLTNPAYVQGADPQVMLRWSDDGGHTWSNEHWTSMGRIGATGARCFFRRLGSTEKLRDRVYELSGTDPVKIALTGAELHASGASS